MAQSGESPFVSRRDLLRLLGVAAGGLSFAGIAGKLDAQETIDLGATPTAVAAVSPMQTIADKAAELEYDQQRIIDFVTNDIQYDSYAGTLRGAEGTFRSRAGNSVDQALLLAALFDAALIPYRFASGPLDDAASAALLAAMSVDQKTLTAQQQILGSLTSIASSDSTPAAATDAERTYLASLPDIRTSLLKAATGHYTDTVSTLSDALSNSNIDLPNPTPALAALEQSQHIWLQYADGPDWIDVETTVPGTPSGKSLVPAAHTHDALPDGLSHLVTFTLVSNTISGEQLQEQQLLSVQSPVADLVGQAVTLLHAKPDSLQGLGAAIGTAIQGTLQYVPYIVIGTTPNRGTQWITFTNAGSTFSDALGEAGSNDGDTVSETLRIEITEPDGTTTTLEKRIFDRLGGATAATPADLSTIRPASIVDDPDLGPTFLPLLAATNITVTGFTPPMSTFIVDPETKTGADDLNALNLAYHVIRDRLSAETVSLHGYRIFPNVAQVSLFTVSPTDLTSDTATMSVDLDLARRGFGFAPVSDVTSSVSPLFAAGVLSHVAERMVIESAGVDSSAPLPVSAAVSTGKIFDLAKTGGIDLKVIAAGSSAANLSALSISDEAKSGIESALASGYAVVVPAEPVKIGASNWTGWWQIHPDTGEALDQLETGGGQDFAEYNVILGEVLEAILYYKKLAMCVNGAIAAGYLILTAFGVTDGSYAPLAAAGVISGATSCAMAYFAGH